MTEEECNKLETITVADVPFSLRVGMFSMDEADRTLLFGYDHERVTWHLYIRNHDIFLHRYSPLQDTIDLINVSTTTRMRSVLQAAIIPNKRLYPEACDFEFCQWVKLQGLTLTFTTYGSLARSRNENGYYGEIITGSSVSDQL